MGHVFPFLRTLVLFWGLSRECPLGEKCLSPGSVPVHQVWGEDAGGSPPSCRVTPVLASPADFVRCLQGKIFTVWCEQLPGCCPRDCCSAAFPSQLSLFPSPSVDGLILPLLNLLKGTGLGMVIAVAAAVSLA